DGSRRPDEAGDLRAAARRAAGRRRARRRSAGDAAGRLAAPARARVRRARLCAEGRDAAALPDRPAGRRRAAGLSRRLLGRRARRVQGGSGKDGAMTTTMDTAVRREVTVAVPVERAFEIFTARISTWWPLESHHIGAQP